MSRYLPLVFTVVAACDEIAVPAPDPDNADVGSVADGSVDAEAVDSGVEGTCAEVRAQCEKQCMASLEQCLSEGNSDQNEDLCEGAAGICEHSCETSETICNYEEAGALDAGELLDRGNINRGDAAPAILADFGTEDDSGVRLDRGGISNDELPSLPDFGI